MDETTDIIIDLRDPPKGSLADRERDAELVHAGLRTPSPGTIGARVQATSDNGEDDQ